MKLKETKIINGIEWVCYKKEERFDYLVTKDILSEEILQDIVDGKRLADGHEVRYNNDVTDDTWENSVIRRILNNKFKEKYLSDIEINEEVRLLTKDEVEKLDSDLHDVSDWYWTMTSNTDEDNLYAGVFRVVGSTYPGYLYDNYVSDTYGVRPVICLKSNVQVTEQNGNIASTLDCEETLEEIKRNANHIVDLVERIMK